MDRPQSRMRRICFLCQDVWVILKCKEESIYTKDWVFRIFSWSRVTHPKLNHANKKPQVLDVQYVQCVDLSWQCNEMFYRMGVNKIVICLHCQRWLYEDTFWGGVWCQNIFHKDHNAIGSRHTTEDQRCQSRRKRRGNLLLHFRFLSNLR